MCDAYQGVLLSSDVVYSEEDIFLVILPRGAESFGSGGKRETEVEGEGEAEGSRK